MSTSGPSAAPLTSGSPPAAPVDLRPLTTSELIDRGFTLYRSHFAGFLLLALLCQTAPLIGQITMTELDLNPKRTQLLDDPAAFFTNCGIVLGIGFVGQIIVFAFEVALTFFVADAYLGRVPSVTDSLRRFAAHPWRAAWTCILNRVLIFLTMVFPVVTLLAVWFYFRGNPPETFPGLIALAIGGVVLLVGALAPVLIVFMRLMVTVQALALEGLSGWKAVQRSSQLVQYDPGLGLFYWGEMRLSFLLLPLFIIELLVFTLTSLPVTLHEAGEFLRYGAAGLTAPPDSLLVLSQILVFLASSLILPLYSIATTLFYYDIRIRREGFDLEFMSVQMETP